MNLCYFSRYLGLGDCDGHIGRMHFIPKQRIGHVLTARGVLPLDQQPIIWDERVWNWGCEHHHHRVDKGFIRFEHFPPSLHEWTEEHGFFWAGEEQGWLAEYREAANG